MPRWALAPSRGREFRLAYSGPITDSVRWSARIGYAGSEGDFSFYDTGGTDLYFDDDRYSTRSNNDYDRLLGQLRFDGIFQEMGLEP